MASCCKPPKVLATFATKIPVTIRSSKPKERANVKRPTLTPDQIQRLSSRTRERYSDRYQKMGRHVRSLGWGTEAQQQTRFRQTLACGVDFGNRSVIDIGSGFGDYFQLLKDQGVAIKQYTGCELNEAFVRESEQRFSDERVRFVPGDVLDSESTETVSADIGVMLGLLNFHWKETIDNRTVTEMAVRNAFRLVHEVLIVDFLSNRLTETYPQEDFVFYHDPVDVLQMALKITPHVVIKHDYEPIPQREFMLIMRK